MFSLKILLFLFRYNVDYPALYASDSNAQGKAFNCKFQNLFYSPKMKYEFLGVQRGHQNTLENYPQFLLVLGLGSIQYPLVSSIGGAIWLLGRLAYFHV